MCKLLSYKITLRTINVLMEYWQKIMDILSPDFNYFAKETERLVVLLLSIKSSLAELNLALKGDLTMSDAMEKLMYALSSDVVPQRWALVAYPSLRPLTSWLTNLRARATQLAEWTSDFNVPKSVWLPGDSPLSESISYLYNN